MDTTPADQVGRLFVQYYYSHISTSPQDIGKYYLRDKSKAVRTEESGASTTFIGRESITQGIAGQLEPNQTRTEISSIVCSELASGDIVVNLVGFISFNNTEAEKFTQVFVLMPDGEKPNKRYACSLDVLTYLHRREEGAAVEASEQQAEPEPEPQVVEPEVAEPEPVQEEPVVQPTEQYYEAPQEEPAQVPEPVQEQPVEPEAEVTEATEEAQAPPAPVAQPKAKPSSWAALVKQPAAPRRVPAVTKPAIKRAEPKKAVEATAETQPAQEGEAATQPEQQAATQQTQGRQGAPRRNGTKPDASGRPRREGPREGARGPREDKDFSSRAIFAKSVPPEATPEQVKELFSQVGAVKSVDVFSPKNNLNLKCAVVEFADAQSVNACLAEDKRDSFVLLNSTLALDRRHERQRDRRPPRGRPTGAPRQGAPRTQGTEAGRR